MLLRRGVFETIILEERPGFLSVMFQGEGAEALFANEAGGHRWQRQPPNEKRGRIHTSTVTVAVLNSNVVIGEPLKYEDVKIQTTKGSGPGGQNRNKVETCIVVTHTPTNLTVRIDGRSQYQNKQIALRLLESRVSERLKQIELSKICHQRRSQIGSGMRGDKIRTYRTQDDQVIDHRTGSTFRLKDWIRGIHLLNVQSSS